MQRQKRHSHSRGIFGADGYAVALLQSTCLEKDVETLNLSCKLAIGERLTSIVAYSRLFPIKSYSILKSRKIMFHSINILCIGRKFNNFPLYLCRGMPHLFGIAKDFNFIRL